MKNWKKGSLHCHTMWSDGRSLPEAALLKYRELNYDFVCLSDHNVYQDDPQLWIQIRNEEGPWPPMLSFAEYQRTAEMLPGSLIEKKVSFKHYIRLKTFEELKAEWERPGEFILIPGMELTGGREEFNVPGSRNAIHCNVFNLAKFLPLPRGGSDMQYLGKMLAVYNDAATENSVFMLNHPWSRVWDVDPQLLINYPEIRLFEICNSGAEDMPEGWIYDREQYWDFVLAHRINNGDPLLFGVASDDAHFYDPERLHRPASCGSGFVVVNCPGELAAENLSAALRAGDFYSSCGVLLDDIVFSPDNGTLKVNVKAEPGVQYRIDFITTKAGFDKKLIKKEFPHEQECFNRIRTLIPPEVGQIAHSVEGAYGEYTLTEDDLYVRAIITSDQPGQLEAPFYPLKQTAWTQPFVKR